MKAIKAPSQIVAALRGGAPVVLSISGGKDSEAMTVAVIRFMHNHGFKNALYFVHADLGRMEWAETPAYVQNMAETYGIPLHIVNRPDDLLEGIQTRAETLKGQDKPPFPSAAARYCTAGWKRNVINTWIRHTFPAHMTVVQCIGLRRDESKGRAKTPDYCANDLASAPTLGRDVLNWYPIASWGLADVWNALGVSLDELERIQAAVQAGATPESLGWEYHPAYAYGNERLSCSMCVLASAGDIANGARRHPETYRALVQIELESGFAFQKGKPLYEVAPSLLTDEQKAALLRPYTLY